MPTAASPSVAAPREIAKRLGIGRSTLYRKVRDLGLDVRGEVDLGENGSPEA